VKLAAGLAPTWPVWPFSILERIDVGETIIESTSHMGGRGPFSILERIDVGETRIMACNS